MTSARECEWYREVVQRRRGLRIDGYETLADVGFDGDYVSPYQISACAADGPVLVAYNWLDAPSVLANEPQLRRLGYLPTINFNRVMDLAFDYAGRTRGTVYVTQAFHLLPATRSAPISGGDVDISFDAVTRHEVQGRPVVALGRAAATACRRHGVTHTETIHPSARGMSFNERARLIALALK